MNVLYIKTFSDAASITSGSPQIENFAQKKKNLADMRLKERQKEGRGGIPWRKEQKPLKFVYTACS